uniref:CHCH domain-containing protein n=1 Tax=Nyssomyia neivai TaxID=330878 RepID=A0A1L8D8N3_9DIPT
MGASNSATRSYSVEPDNPKTDASMDVVGVTEDVMKRLMGYEREIQNVPQQRMPPPAAPPIIHPVTTPPPVPHPSRDRALEEQLRKLHDTIERSEEDFLRTYKNLRHHVDSDAGAPRRNDACAHLADSVVTCYRENSDNPLQCRTYVTAFRECVLESFTKAHQPK